MHIETVISVSSL